MKTCLAVCIAAFSAAGCGAESDRIPAGELARNLGVSHYRTERVGASRVIHIFTDDGPNGVKDFSIGDLELRPLVAGEVGFEGEVISEQQSERWMIVRAHFENAVVDRDVGTFRGRERPGVGCPVHPNAPQIQVNSQWEAALTDPALRAFLLELELVIDVHVPENFVEDRETGFDGYPHVGTCYGHRVLPHGSGYPYQYCSCGSPCAYQYMFNADYPYYCNATRQCWGGAGDPNYGNGEGDTNCCNGSCEHPSPTGASQQTDCPLAGFSANGCLFISDACGCYAGTCDFYNDCYDTCGNYRSNCC